MIGFFIGIVFRWFFDGFEELLFIEDEFEDCDWKKFLDSCVWNDCLFNVILLLVVFELEVDCIVCFFVVVEGRCFVFDGIVYFFELFVVIIMLLFLLYFGSVFRFFLEFVDIFLIGLFIMFWNYW